MWKKILILSIVAACVSANAIKDSLDEDYRTHLKKHNKKQDGLTREDRLRRQENYKRNKKLYEEHNKDPKHKFQLGSNEFSDRHPQRFVEEMCRTNLPAETRALPAIYAPTTPAKDAVNWTSFALPIVNQGACGSCWAFATVAALEMYNSIRGRPKVAMSQQQLVDCDNNSDKGCNGGWPKRALDFIINAYAKKLATSAVYPYFSGTTKTNGTCKAVAMTALNFATAFQFNLNGNETALKSIVSNYGPVSIAMYVPSSGSFQGYRSGIYYDSTCPVSTATVNQCSQVNHAMVVVGYGKDATGEFWIVRNSWGTTWGEGGYIRMARNRGNNCNVACYAMGTE